VFTDIHPYASGIARLANDALHPCVSEILVLLRCQSIICRLVLNVQVERRIGKGKIDFWTAVKGIENFSTVPAIDPRLFLSRRSFGLFFLV
jgi:hypothetical protein